MLRAQFHHRQATQVVVSVNLLEGAELVSEVAPGSVGAKLLLVELAAVLALVLFVFRSTCWSECRGGLLRANLLLAVRVHAFVPVPT